MRVRVLRPMVVVALAALFLSTGASAVEDRYELPGDAVFPEGIAATETEFFVGSTNGGAIFRADIETGEVTTFSEAGANGRRAAVGMKVDDQGRLFVAGGPTGKVFVYETNAPGNSVGFDNNLAEGETFINDVAIAPNGDAYLTDSMNPVLYRVFTNDQGATEFEEFLEFDGTALRYVEGFNLNGIVASEDGRYLVTVQSATGRLFRIGIEDRSVTEIDLGGATLTNGDGMLLDGENLLVIRNQQELVVPVRLLDDFTRGVVGEGFTDPSFQFPTTAAFVEDGLLVVNSQFDKRENGPPELPFNVSFVRLPGVPGVGQAGGGALAGDELPVASLLLGLLAIGLAGSMAGTYLMRSRRG